MTALLDRLEQIDKLAITLATVELVGLIHATAHTAAQGSLRPQRIMLCRCADLLVVAAALLLVRLWTAGR